MTLTAPPFAPLPPAPRKYSAADIYFFLEAGLFDPEAKFELLDGEIVPMSPKGRHHEAMREQIMQWLRLPWAQAFNLTVEHTLKLDDGTLLEPDFLLYDAARRIADAPLLGGDIRLAIEVADSSWGHDTKAKAAKYAAFGIAEYWAIHAVKRGARIHRCPSAGQWSDKRDAAPGEALSPLCAPSAQLRL
jgi:Uma2 family endonuclease